MVEGASDDKVSSGIEGQGHDFGTVGVQVGGTNASFDVPKTGCVIHASSSEQRSLRVKAEADNFGLVANESVQTLPGIRVPKFGGLVERSGSNAVTAWKHKNGKEWFRVVYICNAYLDLPERVVECNGINDVLMSFQRG